MTPEQQERIEQTLADGAASDEDTGSAGREQKAKRQRALDGHDQLMARGAADATRDALHDNEPGTRRGQYTTAQARDRAGHVPPLHSPEPEIR
jgi:hypothetical protein